MSRVRKKINKLLFVALIKRCNLKKPIQDIFDMAIVDADSHTHVINILHDYEWQDEFWLPGKSICQVVQLAQIGEQDKEYMVVSRKRIGNLPIILKD